MTQIFHRNNDLFSLFEEEKKIFFFCSFAHQKFHYNESNSHSRWTVIMKTGASFSLFMQKNLLCGAFSLWNIRNFEGKFSFIGLGNFFMGLCFSCGTNFLLCCTFLPFLNEKFALRAALKAPWPFSISLRSNDDFWCIKTNSAPIEQCEMSQDWNLLFPVFYESFCIG